MVTKEIIKFELAALLLLLVAGSLVGSPVTAGRSAVLNSADRREFGVEVVPVANLPVGIGEVVLTKTRNGCVLSFSFSNNSADRIMGMDYLLLVIDSNNVGRRVVNGTEVFKLKGYANKSLISQTPIRLEVADGYRLFLVPQRVFSRDYVWEVLRVKKVLEAYASGDYSMTPEVVRSLNLVDAPLRPGIIY